MEENPVKKLALLVAIRAHFPEMFRTASSILRNGKFDPILVFLGDEDFTDELNRCKRVGLRYISNLVKEKEKTNSLNSESSIESPSIGGVGWKQRIKDMPFLGFLFKKILKMYVSIFVTKSSLFSFFWHLSVIRSRGFIAERIVEKIKPDVFIFPNIEIRGILGQIFWIARKLGIPTVVVPYAWIMRSELQSVVTGKSEYQVRGVLNRIISKLYPQWVFKNYLGATAVEILAMECFGLPTRNPWMSDDLADVLALESEAMFLSYTQDGVDPKKCYVTGSASHDILYASALDKNRKKEQYIVAFLPPDQTGNHLVGFEFSDYWEMICFFVGTLVSKSPNPVYFSIHPRMKYIRSALLTKFPDIKIYDGDACEIIPGAQFCIGTLSGILRYVLSCGKPLLYYDVFNYHMSEYASVPSVITVNQKVDFENSAYRMSNDFEYFSQLNSIAKEYSSIWGKVDGHAMERIESLIYSKFLNTGASPAI